MGVCRGRLGRLRSRPPGTVVVRDPPALETFLVPGFGDTIMRMHLEVGITWHPVDGTDDEALRKELVLALFYAVRRFCQVTHLGLEALGSLA